MWTSFWSVELKCVLFTAGEICLRKLNMWTVHPRNPSGSFAWVFFLWLTKEKALQLSITTDKEALPHYINAVKLKTQCLGQSCVQGPPPEKLLRLQQQSFGKTLHLLPCRKQWKLKWDTNQSSHLPRPALHSRAEWVLTKTIELGKMCLSVLLGTVGYSWPVINSFLVLFCIKRQCANSN